MIGNPCYWQMTDHDRTVYASVVPPEHVLRKILEAIPWDSFQASLASYYTPDRGRPGEPPLMMLKLETLRWLHNLSDVGVMERGTTDLAYRFFLQIPVSGGLPAPSTLCRFRGRLGEEGFRQIFDQIVAIARDNGVVKDRLRLKDATHVLANIEVPSALALVAQIRDKLLLVTEPFARELVEGERINLEMLRESTNSLKLEQRLLTRIAQLRDMLVWVDEIAPPDDAERNRRWQSFLEQRDLAHRVLVDQEDPKKGDRIRSITDPDARRSKHGDWFDGYMLDISMDPDSEIITQINVLPGNGKEAADALELIEREEAAHGNDIEAVSIDGVGFNGPVLRELQDPEGPAVEVFVPPPKEKESTLFTTKDFVEDRDAGEVTCPGHQTSSHCQRDEHNHAAIYFFKRSTCEACPLVAQCMKNLSSDTKKTPSKSWGRVVRKNDYEPEYRRARQKATTRQYADVRREHMKVERKLGEIMNRHGGRRPRYRGQSKVLMAELMACTVTNVKRLVRLLCAPTAEFSPQ